MLDIPGLNNGSRITLALAKQYVGKKHAFQRHVHSYKKTKTNQKHYKMKKPQRAWGVPLQPCNTVQRVINLVPVDLYNTFLTHRRSVAVE